MRWRQKVPFGSEGHSKVLARSSSSAERPGPKTSNNGSPTIPGRGQEFSRQAASCLGISASARSYRLLGPRSRGLVRLPWWVAMSKRRKKAMAGSSKRENDADDPRFARVIAALAGKRDVPRESRKGFGSGALKVNGKIFAMMTPRAEFVVKIPKARVDELVDEGIGERFEPGPGRVMKEWLALERHPERWTGLAEEAYQFVKGKR